MTFAQLSFRDIQPARRAVWAHDLLRHEQLLLREISVRIFRCRLYNSIGSVAPFILLVICTAQSKSSYPPIPVGITP